MRIALEPWEKGIENILLGYQQVKCHMIFDIKMGENFRQRDRMMAGGHTTTAPAGMTYSSVVSGNSMRIALTIAALNDIEVMACDINNAYLTSKFQEKIWTIAGPEFLSESRQPMIVVRAFSGLKSSEAKFRVLLAETLYDLRYKPSFAHQDVWLHAAVKPCGFNYYELIL